MNPVENDNSNSIAIVGMAGRFPGANNIGEFWENLAAGKNSITQFSDGQLSASGYDPKTLRELPGYVAARGVIDKPEWFDRAFFGIPPKEAEVMDPQHRVFLEVAWDALEDAGCDTSRYEGLVGVFGGMSNNTYYPFFVRQRRDLMDAVGVVSAVIANEKDFLATRLAYKLNLRGPALNIQTACSSSLVTVCVACQNLLTHQCDLALAGGASLTFPQMRGYFYQDGSMTSSDGWCRPFDARATGTVFSSGVGVVALKRLDDALADGDRIYAVIKGQALNNDGSKKVSFAAPSVDGQTDVIALAQAFAGVSPETISYIEAHGTATALGDPIEIAGLSQVFRTATDARQFCALGSVKGNIGHCDAASGVTSLIKTALAFYNEKIPPSINCEQINPALHIEESPFFINTELRPWPRGEAPRRAGVSSFGVGGTNAHMVLEEAPALPATSPARPSQILVLSAKTAAALERRAHDLAAHLELHPDQPLADVAYTLQTGRQLFQHRRVVTASEHADAVTALRGAPKLQREEDRTETPVALMFPGQGAQYAGMGAQLYASEPAFRAALDECAEILRAEIGCDLRELLFAKGDEAAARLRETRFTQPAIFATGYALGRLWMSFGLRPAALIGHSVGEFVAATFAGIFSLADAARLVATRARLVQELPPGAMLAARLSEEDARAFIDDSRVDIAAVNSQRLCVLSGPFDAIEKLEAAFASQRIIARRLSTSHAFHSPMVEPAIAPLAEALRGVKLHGPAVPIVSSVTGKWMTDAEATDPNYWTTHMRATVRFSEAVAKLFEQDGCALVEAGPGLTLTQLARICSAKTPRHEIVHSLEEGLNENESLAAALGRAWLAGVPIDWRAVHSSETRRRVSLPGYPFERQRYFADLPPGVPMPVATAATDGEAPPDANAASSSVATAGENESAVLQDETASSSAPEKSDAESAVTQLKKILTELSGLELADVPATTGLLELGFDSLFLSHVALTLSRKFGVKITFRQLLREFNTLELLAAHLASAIAPASSAAKSSTVSAPAKSPGTPANTAPAAHGPFRPVQRNLDASLSASQQKWLEDFIARYCARTAKSKSYTQQNRRQFADPRAAAGFKQVWKEIVYPIVADRSSGAKLWDTDGNEWTDITLSFGAAMLGHQPQFVVDAIQQQLARGLEIGPTSPLAGEVAALLCELTGSERAAFCNTGSEAVTGALRIARTVTGRTKVVYFSESYHGISDEVLGRSAGGHAVPIAPGIEPEALANAIILDYGDARSLEIIAARAGEIAAVLVEPVQSRRPGFQPREFLHELRALTAQHGIALIFDEIITGFRCDPGGAQAYFGVRADIATYGKVIGGGLPVGAIAGRAEYLDALDGGWWSFGDDSFPEAAVTFFAGTFVRHPLALAAARAVLLHLKENGASLQQTLAANTGRMIDGINTVFAGTPFSAKNFASNWLVHVAPDFKYAGLLFALLRHRGIHIWEGRPCFLSVAHTAQDVEKVVEAFRESVVELEAAGFFSRSAVTDGGVEKIPLTPSQQELFLLCQKSPAASATCNETWTLRFSGELEVDALRGAVRAIVNRHDALRCSFDKSAETLTVAASADFDVPLVDLSELDAAERDERFAAMRAAEGLRQFDLAHGPMIVLQIVKLAAFDHALIFNAHHLTCDGWSCDIFLHELAEFYTALAQGSSLALPQAMQMRDYQRWEADMRGSDEFRAEADFWLEKFRTVPPPLELPSDRAYPPQRSYRGASESAVLPPELSQGLTQLGARHGVTLFTVLLAACKTLLFRLSGERDLVIGIPSAGQNNVSGGDSLIGHCVNLLPLRSHLDGAQPFAGLLEELQNTVLEAFENQRVTYGWLLQNLAVPRAPGRAPLVSAVFNVDPPLSNIRFGKLEHTIETNLRQAFQFDFGINCDMTSAGLRVVCNYNTDILDVATIRRWLGSYRTLLEAAAADSSQRIARLPLLTESEQRTLLVDWNRTEREYPQNESIPALFERQAAKTPDATAVADGEIFLTYAELERRANRLAQRLREAGVKKNAMVAVCIERSADMVVGMLAILKAGAAYVPLAVSFPDERIRLILKDTRSPVLLTRRDLEGRFADLNVPFVFVDEKNGVQQPAADFSSDSATGGSIAYVIYTSGSTGAPKGVRVPHRAVNRLVINCDYAQLQPDDVVAQCSNCAFDAATFEIWGALLNGAKLVVVGTETLLSPADFAAEIRRQKISALFLTTALFNHLAKESPAIFEGVKHVLFGGEACDPRSVQAVLKAGPPQRLLHVYGPTETTTFATWHRITSVPENAVTIPIGRPIANTKVYLLDTNLIPVPVGVTGEIYIGGPGLADGYVNASELTAARFVPSPFPADDVRLYKTGDLARYLPDGDIVFIGRIDDQVKIRGFRVEPGEVETVLKKHPAVSQATVVVRDDAKGGKQLVAYVAGPEGGALTTRELAAYLKPILPEYMLPSAIVLMKSLPLNANGKVDRAALPEPDFDAAGETAIEPRDELERELVAIWKDALGRETVGIRDDFFDLGGHSLMAVGLFAEIEKRLGKKLPIATLFQTATVEELAQAIRQEGWEAPWSPLVPIRAEGTRKPFFSIHGADGGVLFYKKLASLLPDDQPFYGVQALGQDGSRIENKSIGEIAALYVGEVRRVQPQGPYYLGGYSFGGVVALEMAQQFIAGGEKVGLVALFDTVNPAVPTRRLTLQERVAKRRSNMNGMSLPKKVAFVFDRGIRKLAVTGLVQKERLQRLLSKILASSKTGIPASMRSVRIRDANSEAFYSYRPQVFPGVLTLFRAENPNDGFEFDPQFGWEGIATGGLDIHDVPGEHETMFREPHVKILAQQMEACLSKARNGDA
jgi:amino acid adenylation domain-containing protein